MLFCIFAFECWPRGLSDQYQYSLWVIVQIFLNIWICSIGMEMLTWLAYSCSLLKEFAYLVLFDYFCIFPLQNLLMLARSSVHWMPCMMSSKAKSIVLGRRSMNPSWKSTFSYVLTYASHTLQKKGFTSIKIFVSRSAPFLTMCFKFSQHNI